VERGGGYISNKLNANGTLSPYEMNINYYDALACSDFKLERELQVERFVTAHAILMSFMGVPGLYFHSLFGSRGWPEGVQETQKYRAVNREKLQLARLESELVDPASLRSAIFRGLARLLRARSSSACFAPQVPQLVVECPPSAFAILREQAGTGRAVLCVHNVTPERASIMLNLPGDTLASPAELRDIITGKALAAASPLELDLAPYETLWLSN
jgi:sucrose phosphorylase